jgi:hypothetical protein
MNPPITYASLLGPCIARYIGLKQALGRQYTREHYSLCSSGGGHFTSALVLLVPAAYVPRPGGAPSLVTPRGTDFLFETALRWDFLFWLAPRVARDTVLRAILATPPLNVAHRRR